MNSSPKLSSESTVKQITLFVAAPGDVRRERKHVFEVVAELNRAIAPMKNLTIRVISWDQDSHPGYGRDPQAVLNSQIADMAKHDLFLGIMWNRIGTKTSRAISGTVEEFDRAVQARIKFGHPDIWFYFRDQPARIDTTEATRQRRRVIEFREKVNKSALTSSFQTPSDFRDKFRAHLSIWVGKQQEPEQGKASPLSRSSRPPRQHVRLNAYKLFYYRMNRKLTFTGLYRATGIDRDLLRRLERVSTKENPGDVTTFPSCELDVLRRLEVQLNCEGKLEVGKADDWLTQYMLFYETYKGSSPTRTRDAAQLPLKFRTRVVVFDFDGTLTLPGDNRTTWEKLWVNLGYTTSDCFQLHRRFQRKEFSHQTWCDMTMEAFRARGMRSGHLESVAQELKLIDGVTATIKALRSRGIRLYILSGSIKTIIRSLLGELYSAFEEVRANEVLFDSDDVIRHILGTPYDFEGKAVFLRRIIEDLKLSPQDVLFVGNSCNDIFASQSGARTLCVNARHTDPDNETHWTYAIREMKSLLEVLEYVEL